MQNKNKELSDYRISLARDTLSNARMCLDNKFFRDCINRSYYAAFYAARAVLALDNIDFKRHKDVVAHFNKSYVATEIFSREVGKYLARLKTLREESDYSDFFIASEEEARKQCEAAGYIIEAVEEYLGNISRFE